jgi:hypothetical protein
LIVKLIQKLTTIQTTRNHGFVLPIIFLAVVHVTCNFSSHLFVLVCLCCFLVRFHLELITPFLLFCL